MVLTYTLLTLAILALWAGGDEPAPVLRRNLWLLLLVGAVASALAFGIVRPVGLAWIVLLAAAAFGFSRPAAKTWQIAVTATVLVVLAALLMAHFLPGFDNPRVIFAARFSADAIPFTLYLNFDKTVAGLLILGWCHPRITRAKDWWEMLRAAAPWAGGVMFVLLALSLALGYVRFEAKLPEETRLWLWVNLCFTCVAEEALFRGFIQAQLQRLWKHLPGGQWLALGLAALLFGLTHANGGETYVAFATVAGLGYGWVYQRTGRIEATIMTHFALNAVHFFLFTYPALQA